MKLFNSINYLKNKESGKRCFILCNGPSINNINFDLIKDDVIIGMNASTILEEKHSFISDYYVVSDTRFIEHPEKGKYATTEIQDKTIRVFRKEIKEFITEEYGRKTFYVNALKRDGFSTNISAGYFFGCTTTMLALQLAYFLDVKEVFLLGCDLRYSKSEPRFYKEKNPQLEDSFTSIQISNIYHAAKVFESAGKKLYHSNINSLLNPYIEFNDLNGSLIK